MWICLALFRHCSQAQVFQPLPSLQLLVTFHLPQHGAAGNKSKIEGVNKIASFPKKWIGYTNNRNFTSLSTGSSVDSCGSFFFTDKNPNNWLHWLVEQFFRQRIPKQCYQWLGKQNQPNLNKSNHPRLSATPRCSYPASPAHRPPGESIWVQLQRDPRKWMIMMFTLKHAWTLGPGIYPGEPKHGASSETRKPCKTGYIGGLQGDPPLWMQKWFKNNNFK